MAKVSVKQTEEIAINNILFKFPIKQFGWFAAGLPIVSVFICLFTAIIYQSDEVNETVCSVNNLIPSISAVTGIAPQRYLWRFVTALHCTPRLAIGFIYYMYYAGRLHVVAARWQQVYNQLTVLALLLYVVENVSFVCTAYISNVDNYPIHEKLFIVFMMTSLVYELVCIFLFRLCHVLPMNTKEAYSYRWKVRCFLINIAFTAGLGFFFVRHRFYCDRLAFSCFSFCEYGIMLTNVAYHYTGTTDLEDFNWYFARPAAIANSPHSNGVRHKAD